MIGPTVTHCNAKYDRDACKKNEDWCLGVEQEFQEFREENSRIMSTHRKSESPKKHAISSDVAGNSKRLKLDPIAAPHVAYLCMEWGLSNEVPLYCGGLGILAGDFIRTTEAMKLPVVGVGIFWHEGYTKQLFENGELRDFNSPVSRDILEPVPDINVSVTVKNKEIPLLAYTLKMCRTLYLLEPRDEGDRWITRRLYQGDEESRIAQEVVLGIGGVRLLRALKHRVDVFHFNEGHAVLAALELIREEMELRGRGTIAVEEGKDLHKDDMTIFNDAWKKTRGKIVFTTHTPIKDGNEKHDLDIMMEVGVPLRRSLAKQIGGDPFGMTQAALRTSCISNGVSELHGHTARGMWEDVKEASEIISITNGVDVEYWQQKEIREAVHSAKGGEAVWAAHQKLKRQLLDEIKRRTGLDWTEEVLLVGFARRCAVYKRHLLVFNDHTDIKKPLEEGTIKFVFAGKAHPQDTEGRQVAKRFAEVKTKYPNSCVFLDNYSMNLGKLLVGGCDVWMNNPLKPNEASGTSGMKAAMNGVLNLSIADGWWPEGCVHGENGWQIPDCNDANAADKEDGKSLRKMLLEEVVPTYYNNRKKWLAMMTASVLMAEERFSAKRMVTEYFDFMYNRTSGFPSAA